ncbi:MAG: segregation/condensation protein A [Opitutaceae bacterium]|jgi:segregation and condensation protein A|nr:segregation/condensation protein A [Opitutaceae bacterium]
MLDTDYRVRLPVFEGPLDLLLFLIRKNEIDIYDIPIETVTTQYIDILHSMSRLDLDIAGDFFVMAATLMEIKSRLLLPRGQAAVGADEDDAFDPRWELVHQLLQYKKFKEAARDLGDLADAQLDRLPRLNPWRRPADAERPLAATDRIALWNAFNNVLRRLSEKLVVGEIHDEQFTVSDKMEEILALARARGAFTFSSLFDDGPVSLRRLIYTFWAILELARVRKLRLAQTDTFADIQISAREDEPPETASPAA